MKGIDRHAATPNTAAVYEAAITCVARDRTLYIEMVP